MKRSAQQKKDEDEGEREIRQRNANLPSERELPGYSRKTTEEILQEALDEFDHKLQRTSSRKVTKRA